MLGRSGINTIRPSLSLIDIYVKQVFSHHFLLDSSVIFGVAKQHFGVLIALLH
jgi:hypothetical protein